MERNAIQPERAADITDYKLDYYNNKNSST